ncbi:hypothetical protein ACE193_06560 [Bernardetia sp. OM2101]|uniref:hypothetical protein n=1 Tax=Bernardetia sp. OM2101 TaxID=3344876 RepID=UPI0035CEA8EA
MEETIKTLYEDSFLIIKFDERIKLMCSYWTENTSHLKEEEIKRLVTLFVNFLDEYTPDLILSDDSKRSSVYPIELQEWIGNTIAMGAARSNTSKYAIILPQDLVSSLSTEQTVEEIIDIPFELKYFEDEESAKKWFLE